VFADMQFGEHKAVELVEYEIKVIEQGKMGIVHYRYF
jgi:hypothetical protein